MSCHDWLIFHGSPFLPEVTLQDMLVVISLINDDKIPVGEAIAIQIGQIGVAQNKFRLDNYASISYTYGVKPTNLLRFLQGFTTPPSMIIGAYQLKYLGLEAAKEKFCLPSQDDECRRWSEYKIERLLATGKIYDTWHSFGHLPLAEAIYDFCVKDTYLPGDDYYLVGIEASRRTFKTIYYYLEFDPRPA